MMLEQHIRGSRPSDYADVQLRRRRVMVVLIGVMLLGSLIPSIQNGLIQSPQNLQSLNLTSFDQQAREDDLFTITDSNEQDSLSPMSQTYKRQIDRLSFTKDYMKISSGW